MNRTTQGCHRLRAAIFIAGLLGSALFPQSANADDALQRGQMALVVLNQARMQAGAGPLTLDPALQRAAIAHSKYLVLNNGVGGHYEQPGLPGFTGIAPNDRQAAAGYTANSGWGEVVAGYGDPVLSVEAWLGAPFHRAVLLDPAFAQTGYGGASSEARGQDTVEMGAMTQPSRMVRYPIGNSPAVWSALESPSPLPSGALGPTGYPASVILGYGHTLAVSSASYSGPAGPLPFYPVPDGNAYHLIPKAPLANLATYTVSVSGTADGAPFSTTWSFNTVAPLGTPYLDSATLANGVYLGWSPGVGANPSGYLLSRCAAPCFAGTGFQRTFSAQITTFFDNPPPGDYQYFIQPIAGDVRGPRVTARVHAGGGSPTYHSQWYAQSTYPELRVGETTSLWISFKNTGTAPWVRGVWGQQANLGLNLDDKTPYQLGMNVNANWLWDDRIATTDAAVVNPGEIGQFNFKLTAPSRPGIYSLHVRPVVDGSAWMEDDGVYLNITVR